MASKEERLAEIRRRKKELGGGDDDAAIRRRIEKKKAELAERRRRLEQGEAAAIPLGREESPPKMTAAQIAKKRAELEERRRRLAESTAESNAEKEAAERAENEAAERERAERERAERERAERERAERVRAERARMLQRHRMELDEPSSEVDDGEDLNLEEERRMLQERARRKTRPKSDTKKEKLEMLKLRQKLRLHEASLSAEEVKRIKERLRELGEDIDARAGDRIDELQRTLRNLELGSGQAFQVMILHSLYSGGLT